MNPTLHSHSFHISIFIVHAQLTGWWSNFSSMKQFIWLTHAELNYQFEARCLRQKPSKLYKHRITTAWAFGSCDIGCLQNSPQQEHSPATELWLWLAKLCFTMAITKGAPIHVFVPQCTNTSTTPEKKSIGVSRDITPQGCGGKEHLVLLPRSLESEQWY